jgi:hypothetical protein
MVTINSVAAACSKEVNPVWIHDNVRKHLAVCRILNHGTWHSLSANCMGFSQVPYLDAARTVNENVNNMKIIFEFVRNIYKSEKPYLSAFPHEIIRLLSMYFKSMTELECLLTNFEPGGKIHKSCIILLSESLLANVWFR